MRADTYTNLALAEQLLESFERGDQAHRMSGGSLPHQRQDAAQGIFGCESSLLETLTQEILKAGHVLAALWLARSRILAA